MAITDEEFNREINQGALSHPLGTFRYSRAILCLRWIVSSVPGADEAFRQWCRERDAQDLRDDEDL